MTGTRRVRARRRPRAALGLALAHDLRAWDDALDRATRGSPSRRRGDVASRHVASGESREQALASTTISLSAGRSRRTPSRAPRHAGSTTAPGAAPRQSDGRACARRRRRAVGSGSSRRGPGNLLGVLVATGDEGADASVRGSDRAGELFEAAIRADAANDGREVQPRAPAPPDPRRGDAREEPAAARATEARRVAARARARRDRGTESMVAALPFLTPLRCSSRAAAGPRSRARRARGRAPAAPSVGHPRVAPPRRPCARPSRAGWPLASSPASPSASRPVSRCSSAPSRAAPGPRRRSSSWSTCRGRCAPPERPDR